MKGFERRLIPEFRELGKKGKKLQEFLAYDHNAHLVSDERRKALEDLLEAMLHYSQALFTLIEQTGLVDEACAKEPPFEIGEIFELNDEICKCVGYDADEPIIIKVM